MKHLSLAMLIGLSTLVYGSASIAADADKIVKCLRGNFPETISVRQVRLVTTDASGGSSIIAGRVYGQLEQRESGRGLMRGTLMIEEPRNLYGASYLVRETDDYLRDGMFVYLPAVGRVRRISGNFADGPMLGTKFSYFEFKQLINAFGDLESQWVRNERIENRETHVMQFKPIEGVDTRYDKVTTWVDKQTCLVMRAEFSEGGKVRKLLTAPARSIQKSGDHWYHKELHMTDRSDGSKTVLTVEQVTVDDQLSSYRFHPKTFYETR